MPTSVDIKNLKINKLTEAQYDTAVQGGVIGENELSVLTDAELEQIQVSALPTASADELGNIYQFIGTTDANYTNGYFYKCVSDGALTPTYSWSRIDVQPTPTAPVTSVNGYTGAVVLDASMVGATAMTVPSTMPELVVANWSNNSQTVNVTGVTATNVVLVAPAPASAEDYATYGISCIAQGTGTLTFSCDSVPANAITVNVVIFN